MEDEKIVQRFCDSREERKEKKRKMKRKMSELM